MGVCTIYRYARTVQTPLSSFVLIPFDPRVRHGLRMDGSTSESFAFVNLEVCGVCCRGQMTEVCLQYGVGEDSFVTIRMARYSWSADGCVC
jgi:hypothetical protein